MNKTEMADKLAQKADISKAQAAEIVEIIFSTKDGEGIIAVELDAGRKVNMRRRRMRRRFGNGDACQVQEIQEQKGKRRQ